MRFSAVLSLYFGRRFLAGLAGAFLLMALIVYLFDAVELMRRAASKVDASPAAVLRMAAYQVSGLLLKLLPFATLFGAMWTFARLNRANELVVARGLGVSVWQFLAPALLLSLLTGVVAVTVLNPVASALTARYEQMEARYFRGRESLLAMAPNGLWLRQADLDGQAVIHARQVSGPGVELGQVIVFLNASTDRFAARLDAQRAQLRHGYWELEDVLVTGPERPAERFGSYRLPTSLTLNRIQDGFASPASMSFWNLPGFIRVLEEAGFSALRHRLHWHALLSVPVLLCAMVLIAAPFSLRLARRGGSGLLLAGGALTGFALYVVSDVVLAFGLAGTLPAVLAAWTPALISVALGLAMLLHLEDG
jgi:lipopolysaccharide export system permease protein